MKEMDLFIFKIDKVFLIVRKQMKNLSVDNVTNGKLHEFSKCTTIDS